MRPHPPIDVVWDGTRVYRVPSPGEIQAVLLLADGLNTNQVGQALGLATEKAARERVNEAMVKLRALSPAWALYQLYRRQIVPAPERTGDPVLTAHHQSILDVLLRLGLPYDDAHQALGIGRSTLVRRVNDIYELLGAVNHVQVLRRAVETGDVRVDIPPQLWRGEI